MRLLAVSFREAIAYSVSIRIGISQLLGSYDHCPNFQVSSYCCMMPLRQASKVSKDGKHFLNKKNGGFQERRTTTNISGIVTLVDFFLACWSFVVSSLSQETQKKTLEEWIVPWEFFYLWPFITTQQTESLMNSSVNCWKLLVTNIEQLIQQVQVVGDKKSSHYRLGPYRPTLQQWIAKVKKRLPFIKMNTPWKINIFEPTNHP